MPTTDTRQTIRLQGIGLVSAVPATEVQPGDVLVWNHGYKSDVIALEPKGEQSYTLRTRSHHDGKEYARTIRRTRLLARSSK